MRIGLISDTHIPEVAAAIPEKVFEAFQGVDLIMHAGDIYAVPVLDELEKIAPVLAALGDDDYAGINKRVKRRHVLELEGKKIWLVHVNPRYLATREWVESSYPHEEFEIEEKRPDIIISGHEHRAFIEEEDGVLHVCSGSPTLLHYKKGPGTVAILELNGSGARAEIIRL